MLTWFITGASRGLGRLIAQAALDRGDRVAATARTPSTLAGLDCLHLPLDVTDPAAVRAAVTTAHAELGRLDVVVNNAGAGQMGAIEEVPDAAARALFDVNFFAVLDVIRTALPILRAQGSGHIITIGSIGGFIQGAGMGLYGATKFALEAVTEALNAECRPLGIHATIIEPGALRTDFISSDSMRHAPELPAYTPTAGARREWIRTLPGTQPGDPAAAARAIVDLAHTPNPPTRLPLGSDAVARMEAKLAHVRAELDHWRAVAEGIDYQDGR
ncbi:SDR family NAD(P)-dependent oxidoreductase [Actinokineospora soli]|uniref:SDR family NAD(P)-dependent oxidoreductase n=1 Tax=Actinokineospora soli TaxID=1048753 RepID=A0ABW2TJA9_9PSEU